MFYGILWVDFQFTRTPAVFVPAADGRGKRAKKGPYRDGEFDVAIWVVDFS